MCFGPVRTYMTIGWHSFLKGTALEYIVLATKPTGDTDLADWSIAGLRR